MFMEVFFVFAGRGRRAFLPGVGLGF